MVPLDILRLQCRVRNDVRQHETKSTSTQLSLHISCLTVVEGGVRRLFQHGTEGYALPEIGDNSLWALEGEYSPLLEAPLQRDKGNKQHVGLKKDSAANRKMKMCSKVVILALSLCTTLAYPIHRDTREVTWTDPRANQADDKTELLKGVGITYKSHIDSSSLYNQDNQHKHPVAEEMQQKLNMESERLRARLRQELAELRERLSPSPSQLDFTLASMRERLAPLTQQLQSSLSSNTQDLCGQLSLYLQGLETAEVQAGEASPTLHQEAFLWMSQTLELSSSKVSEIISDFQGKAVRAIEHLKEERSELWQEMSSRLGQEVSSLRKEAQTRVSALKTELDSLLETSNPRKTEVTASLELFCQNAALQSEVFQARMERLFQGLEEDLQMEGASSVSSSSSLSLSGSSLQEDFSVKLSALIQDILHSV